MSWKGLRKPAGSLRNSGRHRCRSVFTSWEISAPGIRVLLFVIDRRQKTVICHKRVQSDFEEAFRTGNTGWRVKNSALSLREILQHFWLFHSFGLKFWKVISLMREPSKRNLNLGPQFSVGAVRKWRYRPYPLLSPIDLQSTHAYFYDGGRNHGHEVTRTKTKLKHHRSWKPIHRNHCSCPEEVCCQLTGTAWTTVASRPSRSGSKTFFHPPPAIEHQPAGDEWSRVGFTSAEHLAHNYAGQRLHASWVGDSVTAARGTLSKMTRPARPRALKGTDGQLARGRDCIPPFLKRVFGSQSSAAAACPRCRIWALLSNIRMTVGTVAPQALVIGW